MHWETRPWRYFLLPQKLPNRAFLVDLEGDVEAAVVFGGVAIGVEDEGNFRSVTVMLLTIFGEMT